LFDTRYFDFTANHFWENLVSEHGFTRSCNWVRLTLQARGRSKRMLGTLQNRLPQEMRLRGITATVSANRFLAETFLPAHNQRFAIMVEEPGRAFAPFAGNPEDILCVQEDRAVGKDNPRR